MKIAINFCPTGMVPTKQMTPHVPISPSEIVEQVCEAYELGITIAHLHARKEDGTPSWKASIYRQIFEGVRQYCPDLIICGSSSGRNFPEFEKRSEVLELRPDMCSLTLSSLNFVQQASVNTPDMILALADKMQRYGVKAEFECFDLGMINFGKYLIRKGLATGPYYWNILFGNIAGLQANLNQMAAVRSEIPAKSDHHIAYAGIGNAQLPVVATAIAQGLSVRIGLEDNIWYDQQRTQLATNLGLLKRVHKLIDLHEHELLSSKEFGSYGFYNATRSEPVGV